VNDFLIKAVQDLGVSTVLLLCLSLVLYRLAQRLMPMAASLVDAHISFVRSQSATNERLERLLENVVSQVQSLDARLERLEERQK